MGIPRHRYRCFRAVALALIAAAAGRAGAEDRAPVEVLVRLRAQGPHAVTECAAEQHRRRRPLAAIARDRSDSLDQLNRELGVRAVRPVFRRADGHPLAEQRAALAARARIRRDALPAATRAALPAVPELADVYALQLASGADAAAAAARYAADPHVVWAQVSQPVVPDLAANDPFLASSGSWGQPYRDLWGILHVRAPEAWDLSQGEGIPVAIVDTGIDAQHPDLAANLWVNPGEDLDGNGVADPADHNGIDDDGNGFIDDLNGFDFANSEDANGDGDYDDPGDVSDADPFDDYGHGTHVAGTIAAVANNGIGVAGVAPRARLMAVKGFRATGSSPDSLLARAMVYAAQNGARVMNNSWSCPTRCPSNPVLEDAQAFAASLGVVVVTSAGNRGDDVVFYSPKWRRDNIVVAATDETDRPAAFSNVGFLMTVAAPGASGDSPGVFFPVRGILSTRSSGAGIDSDGGGLFVVGGDYVRWAGTSMSAPHVTGIAALILALHPDYSPDEVRAVMRSSARDLGAPGHDRTTGAGLADALAAVQSPRPTVRALFSSPRPGAVLAPRAEEVVIIRGAVIGAAAEVSLSVGFGVDPQTFDPLPLADPLPTTDGELVRWNVAEREDGPYLLRLAVRGSDGSDVVEFLPVSLERNVPVRLSSPGEPAREPAISGERVIFASARPLDGESLGFDLFARDWSSGEEWRVVSAPGDQHSARLSGQRLAWLDTRANASDVYSCRIMPPHGSCRDLPAAQGPDRREGLDVSGEILVWSEGDSGKQRLRACRWQGRICRALDVPASSDTQHDPVLRGSRLWWREQNPSLFSVVTCRDFPDHCQPTRLPSVLTESPFAASENRMTWFRISDPSPLLVCRVIGSTCTPRQIGAFPTSLIDLALSDARVVWSAPGPAGDPDIYFCEDDPLTGACPVQRLTASPAAQANPKISGTRVVWEDDREGEIAIFGLELPSLDPVGNRSASVGDTLEITVRGRDPAGGLLALGAVFADGTPLAARGAAFADLGDGTGVLTWMPGAADVGRHVVTFTGRSAGRLTTRTSAAVQISSPRAAR